MPILSRDRTDGRYIGVTTVDSADVWVDVDLKDLDSSTGESIPDPPYALVDLFVYETSGANPCYVLLRPHGTQPDETYTGALYIPAGSGRSFGVYIADAPITTIAVSGTARVEAIMI